MIDTKVYFGNLTSTLLTWACVSFHYCEPKKVLTCNITLNKILITFNKHSNCILKSIVKQALYKSNRNNNHNIIQLKLHGGE